LTGIHYLSIKIIQIYAMINIYQFDKGMKLLNVRSTHFEKKNKNKNKKTKQLTCLLSIYYRKDNTFSSNNLQTMK